MSAGLESVIGCRSRKFRRLVMARFIGTILIAMPAAAAAVYKCPDGRGGVILQGAQCPEEVNPESQKAREDAKRELDKIRERMNERARIEADRKAERDRPRDFAPEEIERLNRWSREDSKMRAGDAKRANAEADAARRVCVAMEASGASECKVRTDNQKLYVTLHAKEREAEKICETVVSETAKITPLFQGRGWQVRIFSPFRETPPIAVCTLR